MFYFLLLSWILSHVITTGAAEMVELTISTNHINLGSASSSATTTPRVVTMACSFAHRDNISQVNQLRIRKKKEVKSTFKTIAEVKGANPNIPFLWIQEMKERVNVIGKINTKEPVLSALVLMFYTDQMNVSDYGIYQCQISFTYKGARLQHDEKRLDIDVYEQTTQAMDTTTTSIFKTDITNQPHVAVQDGCQSVNVYFAFIIVLTATLVVTVIGGCIIIIHLRGKLATNASSTKKKSNRSEENQASRPSCQTRNFRKEAPGNSRHSVISNHIYESPPTVEYNYDKVYIHPTNYTMDETTDEHGYIKTTGITTGDIYDHDGYVKPTYTSDIEHGYANPALSDNINAS